MCSSLSIAASLKRLPRLLIPLQLIVRILSDPHLVSSFFSSLRAYGASAKTDPLLLMIKLGGKSGKVISEIVACARYAGVSFILIDLSFSLAVARRSRAAIYNRTKQKRIYKVEVE